MRPAVFLDRDGTINEQMGYINHISRFNLLPRAGEAIHLLNEAQVPVVVVSNQSGLARGYFPENLLHAVHDKLESFLEEYDARIDGLYYCPHHPDAKVERFKKTCDCRKPKTGLFDAAVQDLDIDLSSSYVVGDRWSDIEAADQCGALGILVLTGYGRGDLEYIGPKKKIQPAYVAEDLLDAAKWILKELGDS